MATDVLLSVSALAPRQTALEVTAPVVAVQALSAAGLELLAELESILTVSASSEAM